MTTASERIGDDWRSLHPASILINLVPHAWRLLRAGWPVLLAGTFGRPAQWTGWADLLILTLFFVSTFGSTLLHWATLRYRIIDARLEIESGLLQRHVRSLDIARIQNVERVRSLFHRWFGLEEVRIETAAGTEIEGLLSALSEADAAALVASLQPSRALEESTSNLEIEVSIRDLVLHGLTGPRWGSALIAWGLWTTTFGDRRMAAAWPSLHTSAALVVLPFAAGVVLSIFAYFRLTLRLVGDRWVLEQGLFTRRRVEFRTDRLQEVESSSSWFRRWLGFSAIRLRTAAARRSTEDASASEARIPVVTTEASAKLHAVWLGFVPDEVRWTLGDRRALPLELRRTALQVGLVVFVAIELIGVAGLWWLVLLPLALGRVALHVRAAAWYVAPEWLLARSGYFFRRTVVVARAKIQSVDVMQGWSARRRGLARVYVSTAGGGVRLPWMPLRRALTLQRTLTSRPEAPPAADAATPIPSP